MDMEMPWHGQDLGPPARGAPPPSFSPSGSDRGPCFPPSPATFGENRDYRDTGWCEEPGVGNEGDESLWGARPGNGGRGGGGQLGPPHSSTSPGPGTTSSTGLPYSPPRVAAAEGPDRGAGADTEPGRRAGRTPRRCSDRRGPASLRRGRRRSRHRRSPHAAPAILWRRGEQGRPSWGAEPALLSALTLALPAVFPCHVVAKRGICPDYFKSGM